MLQAHPAATLQVYVIWMPMLPTDARSRWDDHILNDPRVIHLWDEERVAGMWLFEHGFGDALGGDVVWDAYLLFGPDARWEETLPKPIGSRAPVVAYGEELHAEITPLLK